MANCNNLINGSYLNALTLVIVAVEALECSSIIIFGRPVHLDVKKVWAALFGSALGCGINLLCVRRSSGNDTVTCTHRSILNTNTGAVIGDDRVSRAFVFIAIYGGFPTSHSIERLILDRIRNVHAFVMNEVVENHQLAYMQPCSFPAHLVLIALFHLSLANDSCNLPLFFLHCCICLVPRLLGKRWDASNSARGSTFAAGWQIWPWIAC